MTRRMRKSLPSHTRTRMWTQTGACQLCQQDRKCYFWGFIPGSVCGPLPAIPVSPGQAPGETPNGQSSGLAGDRRCLTMCPLSKTTGFEALAQRPHQFVICFFGLIFRWFDHLFIQQMSPGSSLCPRHSAASDPGQERRTRRTVRPHTGWGAQVRAQVLARPALSMWRLRSLSLYGCGGVLPGARAVTHPHPHPHPRRLGRSC